MRAGPLSSPRVVAALNRDFVPVYLSNEDYAEDGPAPREEKAERDRILREAHAAGLSVGTVHAYVLNPAGHPIDSLHVAEGSKTDRLLAMLERAARAVGPHGGDPVVPPAPQAPRPAAPPDALVLHLIARSLDGRGAWGGVIPEDWIVLRRDQWRKLLPADAPAVGRSWDLDRDVSALLLTHVYPATENNDPATNRMLHRSLTATVVSTRGDRALARVEGRLTMRHRFYPHREDDNTVEATLVGYLDFDPTGTTAPSLRLVTDHATYNGGTFGVSVRSVP